ncbi:protein of unknown function [Methylocella tundrae]|uniref:Uncharacterized protein n=1 Tax=Methylocella tundrae TaxID=227605 RepID=A0A4U8Z1E0_METTU|nr:protein of unknown function [Methylocella tundrae]
MSPPRRRSPNIRRRTPPLCRAAAAWAEWAAWISEAGSAGRASHFAVLIAEAFRAGTGPRAFRSNGGIRSVKNRSTFKGLGIFLSIRSNRYTRIGIST